MILSLCGFVVSAAGRFVLSRALRFCSRVCSVLFSNYCDHVA